MATNIVKEEDLLERIREDRMNEMINSMSSIGNDINDLLAGERVRIIRSAFVELYLPVFANYDAPYRQSIGMWLNVVGGPRREAVVVDDNNRNLELFVVPALHSSSFLENNNALDEIPKIIDEANHSGNYGPHYVNNFLIQQLVQAAARVTAGAPPENRLDSLLHFFKEDIEMRVPDYFTKNKVIAVTANTSAPPAEEEFD